MQHSCRVRRMDGSTAPAVDRAGAVVWGDDAALLEALELVVCTLGVTFDLEGAVASAHEGHALASRLGNEAALARFEVYVAMTQSLHGDIAAQARSARSAYERASRVPGPTPRRSFTPGACECCAHCHPRSVARSR